MFSEERSTMESKEIALRIVAASARQKRTRCKVLALKVDSPSFKKSIRGLARNIQCKPEELEKLFRAAISSEVHRADKGMIDRWGEIAIRLIDEHLIVPNANPATLRRELGNLAASSGVASDDLNDFANERLNIALRVATHAYQRERRRLTVN